MEPDPEVIGHLHALAKTPKMEKDFPKMIPRRCEVCHATTGLLRCSACNIYYYCGQAHQKADRATHRKLCDTIKGTKKQDAALEARLRAQTPNPFEAERGRFWVSMTNRTYLKARFLHSEMQVRSCRRQGVEDAVDNLFGSMDLGRGDSQGIPFIIPFMFLRLDRDQQCYDFASSGRGASRARRRATAVTSRSPFSRLTVPTPPRRSTSGRRAGSHLWHTCPSCTCSSSG